MADEIGAAFVYPSSGRRPERLNKSRDVNAPLQLARGWTAGLLGLPGDIEGLGRMLVNLAPAGREHERVTGRSFVDKTPALPTSDFYREWLPGYDPAPAAKAFSGLGALTGGMGATKVAGAGIKGAKAAGRALGPKAAEMAEGYLLKSGLAPSVIKPKGGNWLAGSVEGGVERLKVMPDPPYMPYNQEELQQAAARGFGPRDPETGLMPAPVSAENAALNHWIDTKLNKYIKNEMGTPEDPVRALAERGVTHLPEGNLERAAEWTPDTLGGRRRAAGFPKEGYATTPAGQGWEQLADEAIHNMPASERIKQRPAGYQDEDTWLDKVPPETMTYGVYRGIAEGDELGLPHLIDELRNATNPNSDLPANLRWKPEDLKKVTVPQAVERVAKINEYRAAQMAAAQKAAREGIPLHKEYEGGFQWMAAPDTAIDPKSLQYIKDVGCESGWCTQGEGLAKKYGGDEGRLYVLHDPAGKPVVQISVKTTKRELPEREIPWEVTTELKESAEQRARAIGEQKGFGPYSDEVSLLQSELYHEDLFQWRSKNPQVSTEILEIKGRQNGAPKEEYLPMVQDFVRSGNWSRVGDLHNTQLIAVDPGSELANALQTAGKKVPQYVTQDELTKLLTWKRGEGDVPQGFAKGGFVQDTESQLPMLDEMRLEMMDRGYAAGGLATALKAATKAHPVRQGSLQETITNINKKLADDAAANKTKPIASAAVVNSTVSRSADKIAKANPKLSEAEVAKKAERDALAKLKWERQERPGLEKTYGELEKSSYQDPRAKRLRNVPEVVEERARKAEEFLAQPVEPWKPPESGLQAFDRSLIKDALEGFPGVEQTRFPRYQPARADLSYIDEIYNDPRNRALIEQQIKRGLPLGGETFYASLYPLKVATMERGMPASKFEQFVYETAPASARNSIMNEMAVGQFLRDMKARGLPLDEDTVTQEMAKFKSQYGTGLPLMPVHREGVRQVIEGPQNLREMVKADIPTNYKIPTYGTQKAGDFGKSMVLDVHESAGQTQASRYHPYFTEQGGFGPTEYGLAEGKMLDIAQGLGIPGGMAQAGRWFGGGELTGLKSPRGDALDLLEKQAAYTMQGMGINPTPQNVRKYLLDMIESGEGVLMPYFKSEGMPDYRVKKKEGGLVTLEGAEDFAKQIMTKIANNPMSAADGHRIPD